MTDTALAAVDRLLAQALDALDAVAESGGDVELVAVLTRCESAARRLDRATVSTVAALQRRGVPIVMNGKGQPLDVGRATRTIPDGLRRAVAARDQGCAHPGCARPGCARPGCARPGCARPGCARPGCARPGCGSPPSWSEVHHVHEWELGGKTELSNLVMLCRRHHRQIHFTEWVVRIRDGLPEFIPPSFIDPRRTSRRKALPQLVGVCARPG